LPPCPLTLLRDTLLQSAPVNMDVRMPVLDTMVVLQSADLSADELFEKVCVCACAVGGHGFTLCLWHQLVEACV
jgi:hypothetical protein